MLQAAEHWHVDCTFWGIPASFYQLLIILVYDNVTDLYLPTVFALCSNKQEELYVKLFNDLKSLLTTSEEKLRMTVDFEKALKNSLKKNFDCTLTGCRTHLMAALKKKAAKKKLMTEELKTEADTLIRDFVQNLENGKENPDALLDDLTNKYQEELAVVGKSEGNKIKYKSIITSFLIERKSDINNFCKYISYLRKTWIPLHLNGMIDYIQVNREEWTNNAIEGYNNKIQEKFTK